MKNWLVKGLAFLLVIVLFCYFIAYHYNGVLKVFIPREGDAIPDHSGYHRHGNQCRKYYMFDAPSWTLKLLRPKKDFGPDCKSNLADFIKGKFKENVNKGNNQVVIKQYVQF